MKKYRLLQVMIILLSIVFAGPPAAIAQEDALSPIVLRPGETLHQTFLPSIAGKPREIQLKRLQFDTQLVTAASAEAVKAAGGRCFKDPTEVAAAGWEEASNICLLSHDGPAYKAKEDGKEGLMIVTELNGELRFLFSEEEPGDDTLPAFLPSPYTETFYESHYNDDGELIVDKPGPGMTAMSGAFGSLENAERIMAEKKALESWQGLQLGRAKPVSPDLTLYDGPVPLIRMGDFWTLCPHLLGTNVYYVVKLVLIFPTGEVGALLDFYRDPGGEILHDDAYDCLFDYGGAVYTVYSDLRLALSRSEQSQLDDFFNDYMAEFAIQEVEVQVATGGWGQPSFEDAIFTIGAISAIGAAGYMVAGSFTGAGGGGIVYFTPLAGADRVIQ